MQHIFPKHIHKQLRGRDMVVLRSAIRIYVGHHEINIFLRVGINWMSFRNNSSDEFMSKQLITYGI